MVILKSIIPQTTLDFNSLHVNGQKNKTEGVDFFQPFLIHSDCHENTYSFNTRVVLGR